MYQYVYIYIYIKQMSNALMYLYIGIPARSPVPTPKWHRGATRPASSPDPCSLEKKSGPRNKPDKPSIRHSSWGLGRSSRRPVGVGDLHRMPVEAVRVNFFARVGRIVTDITFLPLPSLADAFRRVAPSPASPFLLNMRDLQTHNKVMPSTSRGHVKIVLRGLPSITISNSEIILAVVEL